jgi:hypothetical protein
VCVCVCVCVCMCMCVCVCVCVFATWNVGKKIILVNIIIYILPFDNRRVRIKLLLEIAVIF